MIHNCRICQSPNFHILLDLGLHPLADTFIYENDTEFVERFYPLRLVKCVSCNAIQTQYSVSGEERYQLYDYSYDSMNSPVAISHFKELYEYSINLFGQRHDHENLTVYEAGSNIGTLLKFFKESGSKVLGIDPAHNIVEIAKKTYNIPTENLFLNTKSADYILNKYGKCDLFCGTNVFNHIDDLNDALTACKTLMNEDGFFVFEVPYVSELLKTYAFDTIYHEHVHYHSVTSLRSLLLKNGFIIYDLQIIDYMCGSLRLACRTSGVESTKVEQIINDENSSKLFDITSWDHLSNRITRMRHKLRKLIADCKLNNQQIVGIGAATKGNTLLNFCGLNNNDITYIFDSSLNKINKLTPGGRIPIKPDEKLIDFKGSAAIILPWNISSYLEDKLSHYDLNWINVHNNISDED